MDRVRYKFVIFNSINVSKINNWGWGVGFGEWLPLTVNIENSRKILAKQFLNIKRSVRSELER